MVDTIKILNLINPPEEILDFDEIKDLLNNPNRLTLIEMPFFKNVEPIIKNICDRNIEGDVINIGIYKGGGSLYMKALFESFGVKKNWWLFDSFEGFDRKSLTKTKDIDALNLFDEKAQLTSEFPSPENIQSLFKSVNLESNIHVIKGFIEKTFLQPYSEKISLLHIDVDFYEPTYFSLSKFYSKLNIGGWVIIDDYNVDIFSCKESVDDFRNVNQIHEPIQILGKYQVGWMKEKEISK